MDHGRTLDFGGPRRERETENQRWYNFNLQMLFLFSEDPHAEIVGVYITEKELSESISNLFMVGVQLAAQINKSEESLTNVEIAGLIVNNSMFIQINSEVATIILMTK